MVKTILRFQACFVIFLVAAIFSFNQVIALDASCPTDPCVNYLVAECELMENENKDIETSAQKQLENISEESRAECDRIDFSENAEESVFDQFGRNEIEELQSQLGITTELFDSLKEAIPTDLNECYDWAKKILTLALRRKVIETYQQELAQKTVEDNLANTCTRCELHDIPCFQNAGPNASALLLDEISFDSKTVNENCKDLRPNWCNNAKTNKFNRFKKLCEKEGSKVREKFCCDTCKSIAGVISNK